MTTWTELKDLQAVVQALNDGWEIEEALFNGAWEPWAGYDWRSRCLYRGRPKQPKKVTMTSECWRCKETGQLIWRSPGWAVCEYYMRFPAGDISGEVEE